MLDEKDLQAIAGLINNSESLMLEEMENYDRKNEKRFKELSTEIDNLKAIYTLTKNENETINTLLRIIENLEKRVAALEMKTA